MNIWILDHYNTEPKYGGISRQYDFALELSKRGHDVTVIASSFSHFSHKYLDGNKNFVSIVNDKMRFCYVATFPYHKNNGIKRIINTFSYLPSVWKNVTNYCKSYGKPDVIVGCSVHPFTWIIAYKIAKKYNSKFIVEVRDLWPANQIYDEGMSRYHPMALLLGMLEKWAYHKCDKIIYSMSRGDLYICDELGVSRDKTIWIAQPMDCSRFDRNRKNYDSLDIHIRNFIGNSFLCVFTGYYMDYEGVYEMLGAAKILQEKNLPIKFAFFGSGVELNGMKEYLQNNNLHNVLISGRVNKEVIPAILDRADICLAHLAVKGNPDSYKFDASKNKINEYMYSNSCIIYGTYVKNQFVQTSGAGFTVEPFSEKAFADKIEEVFFMPEQERRKFGINARKFVMENNTVEKLTDKYESIL